MTESSRAVHLRPRLNGSLKIFSVWDDQDTWDSGTLGQSKHLKLVEKNAWKKRQSRVLLVR